MQTGGSSRSLFVSHGNLHGRLKNLPLFRKRLSGARFLILALWMRETKALYPHFIVIGLRLSPDISCGFLKIQINIFSRHFAADRIPPDVPAIGVLGTRTLSAILCAFRISESASEWT